MGLLIPPSIYRVQVLFIWMHQHGRSKEHIFYLISADDLGGPQGHLVNWSSVCQEQMEANVLIDRSFPIFLINQCSVFILPRSRNQKVFSNWLQSSKTQLKIKPLVCWELEREPGPNELEGGSLPALLAMSGLGEAADRKTEHLLLCVLCKQGSWQPLGCKWLEKRPRTVQLQRKQKT